MALSSIQFRSWSWLVFPSDLTVGVTNIPNPPSVLIPGSHLILSHLVPPAVRVPTSFDSYKVIGKSWARKNLSRERVFTFWCHFYCDHHTYTHTALGWYCLWNHRRNSPITITTKHYSGLLGRVCVPLESGYWSPRHESRISAAFDICCWWDRQSIAQTSSRYGWDFWLPNPAATSVRTESQ